MVITVKVIPNAKKRAIQRVGSELRVRLTVPPVEGRANEDLTEYLAAVFKIRRSEIRIIRGQKARQKVVALPLEDGILDRFFDENGQVLGT